MNWHSQRAVAAGTNTLAVYGGMVAGAALAHVLGVPPSLGWVMIFGGAFIGSYITENETLIVPGLGTMQQVPKVPR